MQNFIPLLGYLPIGPLSLTTIQITVIIAGIVLGPSYGGVVGGTWGIMSFIKAFTAPTSPVEPLIFTNPLVSIAPRILVGIFAGYAFKALKQLIKNHLITMFIIGLSGVALNTGLVLGLIDLFYRNSAVARAYGVTNPDLIGKLLLVVIGTNGIPEAILSGIVTPLIAKPILKFTTRND